MPAAEEWTVDALTRAMNEMVADKGRYEAHSPAPQTPRNIAISLAIEAAEVLEHYQWSEEADRQALAAELADVALYLLQLAYLNDIDLAQAVLDKIELNYRRSWRVPGKP
jgi:NTP pyrophosphatase (non-canonical NTP hydrolase)